MLSSSLLLMGLADDTLVHVPSFSTTRGLAFLLRVSKECKSRVAKVSLQINTAAAFEFVRVTRRYLQLRADKLECLLLHPDFAASTEQVLESAMAWLHHSPASRLSSMPSLYEAVCLPLLPAPIL